jgi:Fic family protein
VAFTPHELPPSIEISREAVHLSGKCMHSLGALEASIENLPSPELITSPFLRREAVLSSKIEGTHTELDQLYLFEAEQADEEPLEDAEPKSLDAREVWNYVRALEYGLERVASLPICNRLLKEMHEILLMDIPEGRSKDPGKFRSRQAYIGGGDLLTARYVATPASAIEQSMRDLERYIHKPPDSLPELVRIALIHYQFESIHPFADGNGRLGRLLVSLLLCNFGILKKPILYLSAYLEQNRDDYNQHMWQVSRRGAWDEWLLFFLKGVQSQAQDARDRACTIVSLREEYRGRFQKSRGSATILALVDSLFGHPVITTNRAAAVMQVTWPAANDSVLKLVRQKILFPLGTRQRNKLYWAKPILDALR